MNEQTFRKTHWKVMIACPKERIRNVVLTIVIPFAPMKKDIQRAIKTLLPAPIDAKSLVKQCGDDPPTYCSLSAAEFFDYLKSIAKGFRKEDEKYYREFKECVPSLAKWCRCDRMVQSCIERSLYEEPTATSDPGDLVDFILLNTKSSAEEVRAGIVNGILGKRLLRKLSAEEYAREMEGLEKKIILKEGESYDVNFMGTTITLHYDKKIMASPRSHKFNYLENKFNYYACFLCIQRCYKTGEVHQLEKLAKYARTSLFL